MSETTHPIKRKRRRSEAASYLQAHGIPFTDKTLANRNAAGLRPRPVYLGTIPFYDQNELDDFIAGAFTAESPVAVTRRKAAELAAAAIAETPQTTAPAKTGPAARRARIAVA
jgi:hypothetical protein